MIMTKIAGLKMEVLQMLLFMEESKIQKYLKTQGMILSIISAISAKDVLEMATIEGARVLGIDSEVGSLEVGKKADIILIDLNKPHLLPRQDIYSLLAYSVNGADVDTSIIDGKIVMEDRKVLGTDEDEMKQRIEMTKNRLF